MDACAAEAPARSWPKRNSEFMNIPLTGAEFRSDPTMAQKFLLAFRKR
jgi:hypothetical protein